MIIIINIITIETIILLMRRHRITKILQGTSDTAMYGDFFKHYLCNFFES